MERRQIESKLENNFQCIMTLGADAKMPNLVFSVLKGANRSSPIVSCGCWF